jgi:protein gp37
MDKRFGRNPSEFKITNSYLLPLKKRKKSDFYILQPDGEDIFTCYTSDFLIPEADQYRNKVWEAIHTRQDLHFLIVTKRIYRFTECIPNNWKGGYDNVTISCTVENQEVIDTRLPYFMIVPIKSRQICIEPLLEEVDIRKHLSRNIERVVVGGESGSSARPCDINWVLKIRKQCQNAGVPFWFKQTGARFIDEHRNLRKIPRHNQYAEANKYDLNLL